MQPDKGSKKTVFAIIMVFVAIAVTAIVVGIIFNIGKGSSREPSVDIDAFSMEEEDSDSPEDIELIALPANDYTDRTEDPFFADQLEAYYYNYALGNVSSVEIYAQPLSDLEKDYITFISDYVNGYNIRKIYSKPAKADDAYLVSVVVDVDFNSPGVDSMPGLDFFYMYKEGSRLYVDNRYSSFNQTYMENEMDESILSELNEFGSESDVQLLRNHVESRYNDILLANPEASTFISETLPAALTQWMEENK